MSQINKKGLINKNQLAIINRQNLKYPLAIAEKDYFLAIISKIIFNSPLKDKLIFKGGTALHHVYLPQHRFSEDLDFSSNSSKVTLNEVKEIFSKYDFIKVKKDYVSNATVKIERLQYTGPLIQPNSLKVEIDFLQNVVLSPLELDYKNVYGINTKVRVMDIREIAAEKIRAMSDRAKYRDFYDYMMIVKKLFIDINEVLDLVKQKEIRNAISKNKILENWNQAKQEGQEDVLSIYYKEELTDDEIEDELNKFNFNTINN